MLQRKVYKSLNFNISHQIQQKSMNLTSPKNSKSKEIMPTQLIQSSSLLKQLKAKNAFRN